MFACDLSCSYVKICPGLRNCTLKVEKERMLAIILMQRELRETLRVQPTNHRPPERGSHSTRYQLEGESRFPGCRDRQQALHSVQGEVAHALLALQTLINRPWPGSILRNLGQVTGCGTPVSPGDPKPLSWAGLHDWNLRKSLLVCVLNQSHLRPQTRQGHPALPYISLLCTSVLVGPACSPKPLFAVTTPLVLS